MASRKELTFAISAVVLAFIAVQGATSIQGPPAAVPVKGEYLTEPSVRSQAAQPLPASWPETLGRTLLGPLVIAAFCYFFVKRVV